MMIGAPSDLANSARLYISSGVAAVQWRVNAGAITSGALGVTDAYVSGANGVTTTGVDTIDLWVGGLAEKQMVFGGLLVVQ